MLLEGQPISISSGDIFTPMHRSEPLAASVRPLSLPTGRRLVEAAAAVSRPEAAVRGRGGETAVVAVTWQSSSQSLGPEMPAHPAAHSHLVRQKCRYCNREKHRNSQTPASCEQKKRKVTRTVPYRSMMSKLGSSNQQISSCLYVHLSAYTHTPMCVYIYIYTYIHTYIHTDIHTYVHTYRYTYIYVHIHIHIHIYTYRYKNLYIYIYWYL